MRRPSFLTAHRMQERGERRARHRSEADAHSLASSGYRPPARTGTASSFPLPRSSNRPIPTSDQTGSKSNQADRAHLLPIKMAITTTVHGHEAGRQKQGERERDARTHPRARDEAGLYRVGIRR